MRRNLYLFRENFKSKLFSSIICTFTYIKFYITRYFVRIWYFKSLYNSIL